MIVDCTSGLSPDPEEAARQGAAQWIDTTASAILELAEHQGRLAAHFKPGNPGEFPGWHAIGGNAVAWGVGPDVTGKAQWISDTMPWTGLAPHREDDHRQDLPPARPPNPGRRRPRRLLTPSGLIV